MSREIFPAGAFLRFPQRGAGFSGLLRRKSAGPCLELFQVMESLRRQRTARRVAAPYRFPVNGIPPPLRGLPYPLWPSAISP